ncbi:MAG TPA: 4'-phosphopantetheinyl transferase superfamily protein [Nitrospirota bacterium]
MTHSSPVHISDSSVHLWWISLKDQSSYKSEYVQCLSGEEKERAGRFHFEKDRERYLISHGILRRILASYTGKEPRSLRFRTDTLGKPEIERGPGEPMISFNLSHSADMMLLGVARDRRIGVDVELISPRIDFLRIAERYFTTEEAGLIREAPIERQMKLFFAIWTNKEAYLKALGCGLGGGLQCCPSLDEPQSTLVISGLPVQIKSLDEWTIISMSPADDYAASIVVDGGLPDLVLYRADSAGIMGFAGALPETIKAGASADLPQLRSLEARRDTLHSLNTAEVTLTCAG